VHKLRRGNSISGNKRDELGNMRCLHRRNCCSRRIFGLLNLWRWNLVRSERRNLHTMHRWNIVEPNGANNICSLHELLHRLLLACRIVVMHGLPRWNGDERHDRPRRVHVDLSCRKLLERRIMSQLPRWHVSCNSRRQPTFRLLHVPRWIVFGGRGNIVHELQRRNGFRIARRDGNLRLPYLRSRNVVVDRICDVCKLHCGNLLDSNRSDKLDDMRQLCRWNVLGDDRRNFIRDMHAMWKWNVLNNRWRY
jgi:hypothetical protein